MDVARLAIAALAVVLVGCTGPVQPGARPLIVGMGDSNEQRLLAALTVEALEQADLPVEVRPGLGDTVGLRREALRGNIDLLWDYTGAAWALGLLQHAPPADPHESYERVRSADERNDLVWLEPTAANATLALFVRADDLPPADEPRAMSWLAGVLSSEEHTPLCADRDFIARPGGLDALGEAYDIARERLVVRPASESQAIAAVAEGECFAGLATATSGAARLAGLVPVSDDLGVFPAFVLAPVARADTLDHAPAVREALAPLIAILDTPTLATLNAEVEGGEEPEALAARFLGGA
jgi:osmoprotectant transport system substrate-binding protein